MATRSIIEIDLNDAAFKRFIPVFEKYQAAVGKLPGMWREAGTEQDKQARGFRDMAAAMLAMNQELARTGAEEERQVRTVERQAGAWRSIASYAANTAASVGHAAVSFAKWSALGLLGAGVGLLGFDRLAANAAGVRRTAAGLDISGGQARAFGLNFGRFVDSGSVLGGVSGALHDVTSRGYTALLAAGLDRGQLERGNAADVSASLLRRLPEIFRGTPQGLIGARLSSLGLDQLGLTQQDVTRYLGASSAERAAQHARYGADARQLELGGGDALHYQNFVTQLDRAGQVLETTFQRALVGLAEPIGHVSEGFTKLVDSLGRSDTMKGWIDKIGAGLETFAKYIGTPDFQRDVETLAAGVAKVARAIGTAVSWIAGSDPDLARERGESADRVSKLRAERAAGGATAWQQLGRVFSADTPANNPGNLRNPNGVGYQRFADEASGIRKMAWQLRLFQRRDKLDTIQDIVSKYAPETENDTRAYIGDVSKRTGFAPGQHLDLANTETLARLMSAMIHHEGYRREVSDKQIVEIIDSTGGNVNVSTSMVAR